MAADESATASTLSPLICTQETRVRRLIASSLKWGSSRMRVYPSRFSRRTMRS